MVNGMMLGDSVRRKGKKQVTVAHHVESFLCVMLTNFETQLGAECLSLNDKG